MGSIRAGFDDVRSPRDGAARGTSPLRGEVDLLARSQRNTLYAAEASIRHSLYWLGLMPRSFAIAASLARCCSIDWANSAGPPTLRVWPGVIRRDSMLAS